MSKWIALFLIGLALTVTGCSTSVQRADRSANAYSEQLMNTQSASSLFASDSSILSDDEIKKILAFRYKPQENNRIAIMPMGHLKWFGWSDELDKAGAAVQKGLVDTLKKSQLIYDASYLPTLLVPNKKEVGYLREAAARYQSDLMLIYRATFRTYEKYRMFSPDKAKAYCNLEAVLLDTRTGIVPFTTLVTKALTSNEQKSDMSFYETRRKTEILALKGALSEVGDEVVKFLSMTQKPASVKN